MKSRVHASPRRSADEVTEVVKEPVAAGKTVLKEMVALDHMVVDGNEVDEGVGGDSIHAVGCSCE